MEAKKITLQNEIKRQELAKVVMIQNDSFSSQHAYQEKIDVISARFVYNIFIIIVLVLALAFGFLIRYLAKKKLLNFYITRKKD
ncbi:hypothetical protein KKG31_02330 [Patescibacteria group bacterium]|nr:hypothetical protein [Patescibacteria group bacterium]MBU1758007.1 hypothetical protein [Patescibacteria group bacterium]